MKSNKKYPNQPHNSNYILDGSQVLEKVQQVSLDSTCPTTQTAHEEVRQQLLSDSTTPISQATRKQVQQQSQFPTTVASQSVHEQIQQHPQDSTNLEENNQSKEQGLTLKKKKRGVTHMLMVHGRSEHKLFVLNKLNQPVGLTKVVVSELGNFLGILARNGTFCPLNIFKWKMLKTHYDMWNYVKGKYDIPEARKEWVLRSIKLGWSGYKCRLKKKYTFMPMIMMKFEWQKGLNLFQNLYLRKFLNIGTSMKLRRCPLLTKRIKNLSYPHTVGKTSFTVIREEKKKETPDSLSDKDFFVVTRKRIPGEVYKDSDEDTTEMESIETHANDEDGTQSVDAFTAVIGRDHPGRVRLYGRVVTKTLLK